MLGEIKDLIDTLQKKLSELQRGVTLMDSTHSIAQDALRAGFQTSCAKGLAKLFKVDDVTVEQCNNFLPRHLEAVKKKQEELTQYWTEYCNVFPAKKKANLLKELTRWQFIKRSKIKGLILPNPKLVAVTTKEPFIDIPNGCIRTEFLVEVSFPEIYKEYMKENDFDPIIRKAYDVTTIAKRGVVTYESYSTYNKSYVPDEVVEVVKEALAIGLKDIQVAYPSINDGKVPDRDPIVVGYLMHKVGIPGGNEVTVTDMYMLAWFGYDAKQPMACNI